MSPKRCDFWALDAFLVMISGRESRPLLREVRDARRLVAGFKGGAAPRVGLQSDDETSRSPGGGRLSQGASKAGCGRTG